ncbi:exodeoxyribonuclease V subunit beta [Glaesserella parasuis]|uniref:exodeoxyribonuclease V subunit beta n=1 Tax=Glaesserella parasuis TaxID=738 RepID=UPI00130FEFB0|nr:exodeoxyribonuclease V subunit beta [Glaesserella parasuis]MDG6283265.1 exodeoxyribonuclease V subunit beta [Glaesserella parasuis]MDG6325825.1 exodeoxyribonuclease V subunit beta [Glaesserella parasuis]MDG6455681.1 exodeoxyribonuclease V subunit beta [Glaesserella parasuis]MDO9925093.1 exodeoxyribonuclease V subunit beta [Glaesserella parasuis]MDO9940270.1 exodeoxyribonuclease V subunit beta [Glaesserella parasuis]
MNPLNSLQLALNQSSLIEASAGTGKTYTMANLYLRLILGVRCPSPLTVEQILVVTFTKAATQELRDRIREKLVNVGKWFRDPSSKEAQDALREPFLAELYQEVQPRLNECLLRLSIAEREIDLASIFTIDSFCQKMLFQFAFSSGIRFDIDLLSNEDELLTRLSEETWRELFYPMGLAETVAVAEELKTPSDALTAVKGYLYGDFPDLAAENQWLTQGISSYLADYQALLQEAKQHWLAVGAEAESLIVTEINKSYKKGEKKSLSRRAYQMRWIENWLKELNEWATSGSHYFPTNSLSRFCQDFINEKAEEGAEPLTHTIFAKNQDYLTAYQTQFEGKSKAIFLYQFFSHLRQKLADYKQTHKEKSFGDMLSFLLSALQSERGDTLAQQIRALYPFAMIDEFQDTNQQQYEVFHRIFMDQNTSEQGFIMIGDPKQSIYKFRGADIFTYLKAKNEVQEQATLDRNWRSVPEVVESCNRLFQFPEGDNPPFLYHGIPFQPVKAKEASDTLVGEQATRCLLISTEFDEQLAATHCAYQIQQQLKKSEQGLLFVQKEEGNRPLEAKDITILVRSHKQASLIRAELLKRHIPSVFFSERNSVYETQEAQDLRIILSACLNPYRQSSLLSAIGTSLWGLTSTDIFNIKQDEKAWDNVVESFVGYQQVWLHQGILPMLHQIFVKENIIQRINALPNAERRITDLLHLAELLQGAMPNLENEFALLRWYEQQLDNPDGYADEQKQRLESEESLVKVVTIHGSKGLEYPVVWLPFVAKASQPAKSKPITIYQNDEGKAHWSFGSQSDEIKKYIDKAEFAEDLRLLYVAVTRAKYQLNLILPSQFDEKWNSLSYLLSNGEIGTGGIAPSQNTQYYLAQKGIKAELITVNNDVPEDNWQPTLVQPIDIEAKSFTGKIRTVGQITSFTALQAQNERLQHKEQNIPLATFGDEAQDYDRTEFIASDFLEDNAQPYSRYQFPHSTKVGNLLHKFFEHWDFQQAVDQTQLQALCEQLNLDEAWLEPLTTWFEQVIQTPFGEQAVSLTQIFTHKRLNEWQFYLRLSNKEALYRLNQLLKKHSPLAKQLPDLTLYNLEGFVRGFVDCIAQIDGKFYVIDYKSNFLGYLPQDYQAEKLAKTMGQFRYDLQYLLYTLAVHRYLSARLGENYNYEQHFGGVAYLFLRGMNGEPNSGVYFDKPSMELIEEMDRLFG